jgi:cytochrome oxidase Cu insertion factor (SCO1/SenC/PrrC family)
MRHGAVLRRNCVRTMVAAMSRKNLLIFVALALSAFAVLVAGTVVWMRDGRIGLSGNVTSSGTALVGGPFTLTDQTGREVTDETFKGRYMLVYFGYTYCPDVCPTSLQVMMAALDAMGDKAGRVQPIFISVDPERDTVKEIASYVEYFGDDLIGLTGTPEQIAAAAKAYRVFYQKVEQDGADGYLMDHSSIFYLMGPDGAFVKHFSYQTDPETLAEEISAYVS